MSLSSQFDPWSAGDVPAPEATETGDGDVIDADLDTTYVAIDGLDSESLSDEEIERLEHHVLEFALTELDGAMPTGARVLRDNKGVVEIDTDAI